MSVVLAAKDNFFILELIFSIFVEIVLIHKAAHIANELCLETIAAVPEPRGKRRKRPGGRGFHEHHEKLGIGGRYGRRDNWLHREGLQVMR